MRNFQIPFLIVVWLFLFAGTISQITTFQDNQVLTAAQLNNEFGQLVSTVNALDNANIASGANVDPLKISAVIDGSGIERSGVTGALSAKVDNSTIEIASDALRIKSDAAGSGLTGGGASALAVNVDNTTIEINSDALRLKDGGVTQAKRAAATTATTSSSGAFTTTSSSFVTVTNQSQSFTTVGRPVAITVEGVTDSFAGFWCVKTAGAGNCDCRIKIRRDSTDVTIASVYGATGFTDAATFSAPPGSINAIDIPSAGTYTYTLQVANNGTNTCHARYVRMKIVEL